MSISYFPAMLIVATDVLLGFVSLTVPLLLSNQGGMDIYPAHLLFEAITILTTMTMLAIYNGYVNLHRPVLDIIGAVVLSVAVGGVIGGTAVSLLGVEHKPVMLLLVSLLLYMLLITILRVIVSRQRKQTYYNQGSIFVCADDVSSRSSKRLESVPVYFRVTGILKVHDILVSSNQHLSELVSDNRQVIIDDAVQGETRKLIVERLSTMPVDIYLIPSLSDLLMHSSRIVQLSDTPFLTVQKMGLSKDSQILKRVVDIFGSLVLLIVSAPLFVLVPVANWLLCPGPTFYRQERVGKGGKEYSVLKFRSMVPNAEKRTGAVFAARNDMRVTSIGKVLRASRLDEIPQLINVLKGEMSLVGPRPERMVFIEKFAAENPYFRMREMVKPGITGLAQVWGRYDTHPDNKLRFDLIYITSYSVWLDIRIILWTVQIVLWPQELVDAAPAWISWLENGFVKKSERQEEVEALDGIPKQVTTHIGEQHY